MFINKQYTPLERVSLIATQTYSGPFSNMYKTPEVTSKFYFDNQAEYLSETIRKQTIIDIGALLPESIALVRELQFYPNMLRDEEDYYLLIADIGNDDTKIQKQIIVVSFYEDKYILEKAVSY